MPPVLKFGWQVLMKKSSSLVIVQDKLFLADFLFE